MLGTYSLWERGGGYLCQGLVMFWSHVGVCTNLIESKEYWGSVPTYIHAYGTQIYKNVAGPICLKTTQISLKHKPLFYFKSIKYRHLFNDIALS